MRRMTAASPDPLHDWVEEQAGRAGQAGADCLRDLIRRERERSGSELSMDELRGLVADATATS